MNKYVLGFLLFASVAASAVTFSQESEDNQTDQEKPVEEESPANTNETKEGESQSSPTKESPDHFDPTEEISEDHDRVAFPVDI